MKQPPKTVPFQVAWELWDALNSMVWQFGGEESALSAGEDAEDILAKYAKQLDQLYMNSKQRKAWRKRQEKKYKQKRGE
jgi:hypothetical protein